MPKRGPSANKAPVQKRAKRLNVKAALHDGSLLMGVTLTGLQVSLQLAASYNQVSDYESINQALYKLYQASSDFQASFESPKKGEKVPILQLKESHDYVDENAIFSALKAFAAPQKRLNVKAALRDGNLLTSVTLAGLQVTLHIAAAHSQASDYKSINQTLYNIYQISPAFQASFEQPNTGTNIPVLRLKENHGYADENAILRALKAFAVPQKPLNLIAALKDGSLLTGVTLADLQVTLQLAAAYNQANDYRAISKALYDLYRTSMAFQATFEQPKRGMQAPVLRLKENHGYVDESAILNALKAFVAPQKRLKVKAALKEGSLLTGVTLSGLQATLQLAAAYNHANDYHAINKVFYELYKISSAFQVSFERPRNGVKAPTLQLKENHGYADGKAILAALIGFAQDKKDEPLSENASSEAVDIVEPMPAAEEEISSIPEQINNVLINDAASGLLTLLGERLVTTPSTVLTIERASSPFQPLRDLDLEANRVAQTSQEILGEDNAHDCDIEKNMRNFL